VKVVVFSDFECPFCKRLASVLRAMERRNQEGFAVVHRNFPLASIHPHARSAAIAAECAAKQGRFPQYHDLLFERQDSLGLIGWTELARRVRVGDLDQFERCLKSPVVAKELQADSATAEALQIKGTPLIIVDGWLLQGLPPESRLDSLIFRGRR